MAEEKPLITMKKTFFYKFIPSKAEEEACKTSNTEYIPTRKLIEIRDIYSAPKIDLKNPWQIKKRITRDEVVFGKLVIPFFDTFEYILRYWNLSKAKSLVNGVGIFVILWDVTEENDPKIYESGSICFEMMCNDDYSLLCMPLFNDRGLAVGNEIGIYWDPRCSSFMFKLLSQVRV
ncbi:B3 domain-containing protein At5g26805-like [Nicotiana tomentosiformis]|uniref:B3 domain-containing protein At5g26805-like n=1 Tax=Nicotiana tomentosiformis TaxID=4098 RepID=UPI00388CA35A